MKKKTNITSATSSQQAKPTTKKGKSEKFAVVGIGASAGGLAAFEDFFSGMPKELKTGFAFVLVQHLAPDHKSMLTEIIQRYTSMQVFEVTDGMKVQPNCTYIIPPKYDMAFAKGELHLSEPIKPRGQRFTIDFFFKSLAKDQLEHAIGIILSGTGSDGTLGIKAIRDSDGMVMVQQPDTAEYDGMPRSAIATGLVDYELAPSLMPAELIDYVCHNFSKALSENIELQEPDNALDQIFMLLLDKSGHDFSEYKSSSIIRRIERRMAVHNLSSLNDYVSCLQTIPSEANALFNDLLIGVTRFFRDLPAFKILEEQIIPKLLAEAADTDFIRIWVPGCSSGEEAYSIAIILKEKMKLLKQRVNVQIFATDISSKAIAAARYGHYPVSINEDLSQTRVKNFFNFDTESQQFRIHKEIRDMVVFSEHDVILDPPFSKLDLISCRNVLIYMDISLQKKILSLFHYALKSDGILFLGSSENVTGYTTLFSVLDSKTKLYRKKDYLRYQQPLAFGCSKLLALTDKEYKAMRAPLHTPAPVRKIRSLREITEQAILQHLPLSGALINDLGDILYLHGRTGQYLEPVSGDASAYNILKMARRGLQFDLTMALSKVRKKPDTVHHSALQVKNNEHYLGVDLTLLAVTATPDIPSTTPVFLVLFEPCQPTPASQDHKAESITTTTDLSADNAEQNNEIRRLKQQLRIKDEYLQSINESLEASNQELKSSNEEMQSINEELQSSNEELETSKEELQSTNEELNTVNSELQDKLLDLYRLNNDMNNLLSGTGIATIFVDLNLKIMRFTPAATKIINFIASDIGRPITDIHSNLINDTELITDVRQVLNTLIPKSREVETKLGHWYTMQLLAYRTIDNAIEGCVITFSDITEIRHERELIREKLNLVHLGSLMHDARDAFIMQDLDGRILAWNNGAVRLYGWTEQQALTMNISQHIPSDQQEQASLMIAKLNQVSQSYQSQRLHKNGSLLDVSVTATALVNESDNMYAVVNMERPLEGQKL
ncbi:fused CheR-type MCP methyltransferase and PAS sensor protein [Psychromonas ingrahamii 37]|uniref:protein-glutamate O-methyltransferase n=1 Tax=Psychromonas ingrahamii (strain DSM 17664 / CCUG 51855 / 37) TaxID=357804 RepID=A1SXQ5_PSYIN|nr:chemotaxis protein CheB [Psychromonas ingrahamii]ABM04270.1 fused CheR-type MCP methyltransferase and PAS sensor protein [Psychromonas ingrahamii 37]